MKLAVPNDEARAAKVLLYEGIFYQVVAEESSERPLEASGGASSGGNSERSLAAPKWLCTTTTHVAAAGSQHGRDPTQLAPCRAGDQA